MTGKPKRTFAPSRLIALLGLALLGAASVLMCPCGLIYPPALLAVIGFPFFLLLATFGADYLRFIPDSFLTLLSNPPEPNARYAEICRCGSRYTLTGAAAFTVLGFIQMLSGMTDPTSLAAGFSILLLPALYALILSEVFFTLLYKVYSNDIEQQAAAPLKRNGFTILMAVLALVGITASAALISFAL